MSESSNKPGTGAGKAGATATGGGRPSPILLGAVVGLAVIVVAVLAVLGFQVMGKPTASDSSVLIEGTRKGPRDAKVIVLDFSDFQ